MVRIVLLLAVVAGAVLLLRGHPGWALGVVLGAGLLSALRTLLLLRRHRRDGCADRDTRSTRPGPPEAGPTRRG